MDPPVIVPEVPVEEKIDVLVVPTSTKRHKTNQSSAKVWWKVILGKNESEMTNSTHSTLITVFNEICKKFVFQLEKSPKGHVHWQCNLNFAERIRKQPLITQLANAFDCYEKNVQILKSDEKFSEYCSKRPKKRPFTKKGTEI